MPAYTAAVRIHRPGAVNSLLLLKIQRVSMGPISESTGFDADRRGDMVGGRAIVKKVLCV